MQKKNGIQFHRGSPDPSHLTKWFGPTRGGVLVLDDLMAFKNPRDQTGIGPFYCKPFPTVGVKSCTYLNASRRAPLAI